MVDDDYDCGGCGTSEMRRIDSALLLGIIDAAFETLKNSP
jgi:hypothetical protein